MSTDLENKIGKRIWTHNSHQTETTKILRERNNSYVASVQLTPGCVFVLVVHLYSLPSLYVRQFQTQLVPTAAMPTINSLTIYICISMLCVESKYIRKFQNNRLRMFAISFAIPPSLPILASVRSSPKLGCTDFWCPPWFKLLQRRLPISRLKSLK